MGAGIKMGITNENIGKALRKIERRLPKNIVMASSKADSPFRILVATVLSARTKDETTHAAVNRLFSKMKTKTPGIQARVLARMDEKAIRKLIYPVGFYKTKARHIKRLAGIVAEEYNGKIPDTLEQLTKLPGVGRKTANLVLSQAFGKDAICVDTHVHRITNRWGYVKTKTPEETEMALRKKLPRRYWQAINGILVKFGRAVCRPARPLCPACPINNACPYGINNRKHFKH